ncbi:MAG: glycosyltransferase [Bacteroidetes bacterium]|nr:glycosyltransferase [Bacteroidota bacterium]MBU1115957.1 glycosyltransferase [Bacteroidota bacterium]MBU1798446.1 glycosyltransferase [Bacteroidota bacterium]
MIDISIIIVNYNVKEFVKNLLYSLQKALDNFTSEIIIVDNASSDGSVPDIKEKFDYVNVIANKENIGFGKANNQGLQIAKGKYIVLLNPDTIVREDTFTKLIEFMKATPNAGMVTCKVLNPDGSLQLACRRSFPGPWVSFTKIIGLSKLFPKSKLFAKYNLTYLDENKINEVDAVSGSFMVFTKEVYEKVGGFDPQFFMYGEDLDLCYRVQQAGYKVFYVPETEIIHYKGESTKRSSIDEGKIFYNAMHLFVKKHLSSSFLVEIILRSAIIARRFIAFVNSYKTSLISGIIDFSLFTSAYYLAEKFYRPGNWSGFPEEVKPWIFFFPALLQLIISSFGGTYKRNAISVLRAVLLLIVGFIFSSALTYFLKQYAFSRAVLLITYIMAGSAYVVWRFIAKIVLKIGIADSVKNTKTLIVGSENYCIELSKKLDKSITDIYTVVGFISETASGIGKTFGNYSVLGSLENIVKVIKEEKINKVIFASHEISFEKMFKIVSQSDNVNVEFLVAGTELDYLVGKSSVTMLENIPLLKVHYNISEASHKILKSIFDISFALLLLLVFPFAFIYSLFQEKKGCFVTFILQAPFVLTRKKSFVGPKNTSNSQLYLGKQGLTGLWFFEKSNLSDKSAFNKLDVYYAKNQNIWLDLEILGKSFSKMFFDKEK